MQTLVGRVLFALIALVPTLSGCRTLNQDVETIYLPDRERWQLAHAADDGHATLVEYVPPGQKIESWRELMTVQALDDRRAWGTPRQVMDALHEQMRSRGGNLEWKVIEELPSDVYYEWTIANVPGVENQGEIARLSQGKDTMHRAAYAYKGDSLAPDRRADRLALLRNGRIVKGMAEMQAAMVEFFPGHEATP